MAFANIYIPVSNEKNKLYAITYKIAAGVDIADIARAGITHIQNHYLHPNEGMHRRAAMKNIITEREAAFRETR